MSEPVAYLYGRFLPATQASISIADAGFVLGVTATEQLRTFSGRLFRLEEHFARLAHSLDILHLSHLHTIDQIAELATEIVARNYPLLANGDDLGVGIFVTPGPYPTLAEIAPAEPVVGLYSFPLPFQLWSTAYDQGQSVRTTNVEQVSARCWPRELKVRSRVHYYLADRAAAAAELGARALLLDHDGFVTESTTSNLFIYRNETGLLTPPAAKVLPGITLKAVRELASTAGIPFAERDLRTADIASADEVMVCSTSSCILPIVRFNGQPIADGKPGPVFRRLLGEWSRMVGFDIVEQARRFTDRQTVR